MSTERCQATMFRGAKVSRRYRVEPSPRVVRIEQGVDTQSAAYILAKANEHKPWARRWLRMRRYL
jgi:hypothetical protein